MTIPVNEEQAREYLRDGHKVKTLLMNRGYVEVFKPVLEQLLKDADTKCHDYRLRTDRGKEAIVEFNTIRKIMDICSDYIENFDDAIEYCKDNNIQL